MEEKRAIRVVVVDDHHFFRHGLRSLLEEHGFEVAGEATSGDAAVGLAVDLEPDVVVMDLHMPGISGVEATRRLSERGCSARILVLTISAADSDVVEAMVAGACGYLLKDTSPNQIAAGVRAAAVGESMLSASVAARLVDRVRGAPRAPPGAVDLSEREVEVLRLIGQGRDNAQIAERLVISPMTAKNHVSNILAKLGVESRTQAAIYAVRAGIV
jgi:two-component system, NarL family, response regulator LiaR